jgi:hypothetical protein
MRLDPGELGPVQVDQFLRWNHAEGHRFPVSVKGAMPLLVFLRGLGVVPEPPAPALDASEQLLERFRAYLASERGLAEGTIGNYVHAGRLFLRALERRGELGLGALSAADVDGFVALECRRHSIASAKNLVSGLRSLLGFLYLEGITASSLSGAVPAVSGWTGGGLSRRKRPAGRADEQVVAAMRRAIGETPDASSRTAGFAIWRMKEILAGAGYAGPVPSDRTLYRLFGTLSHGRHATGPASTRRSLAGRPQGMFGSLSAAAPGEIVQIDSTPAGCPRAPGRRGSGPGRADWHDRRRHQGGAGRSAEPDDEIRGRERAAGPCSHSRAGPAGLAGGPEDGALGPSL